MKKILFVTTISSTINAFLIPHIELLINMGHTVDIACNVVRPIDLKLIERGCRVFNIDFQRSPFKKKNYKAYKKLKKLIQDEKYDLIHTHTPVASACVRLACRRMKNVKVIYTVHGFHFFKGAPLKNWLLYYPVEKWLARYTDVLITINREDYETAIKKNFKAKRIDLVNGVGIDLNKFKPQSLEEKKELRKQYGYDEKDFILIYAAEINKNKNQKFLIDGIKILKNKIPNIKLLFAGEGVLKEEYKKYVRDLKLNNDIVFLGYRKDLDKLIPMCDIGVSASIREGFGINVIEYLASGLPVIVSNNRGHKEIIENGLNGFLYEQENLNQFVGFLEKIYYDNILKKQLSENARRSVEKFSVENSLKEMEEIYRLYIK